MPDYLSLVRGILVHFSKIPILRFWNATPAFSSFDQISTFRIFEILKIEILTILFRLH